MRLAHIINPVVVDASSDLYLAQPITFESMVRAKDSSRYNQDILLLAICYAEDQTIVPPQFTILPDLSKSVLNYGQFTYPRKLPLIRDILSPLKEYTDLDYIIYTNVDISLMPYFYDFVFEKLKSGVDSLVINRRTVAWGGSLAMTYPILGKSHPGYDCFIFRRELLEEFQFGTACIGANWIGRILISNLIMYCNRVEIIRDSHLTFHIGEDGAWQSGKFNDYDNHNLEVGLKIIREFIDKTDSSDKRAQLTEILEYMMAWKYGPRPKSATSKIVQKVKQGIFRLLK